MATKAKNNKPEKMDYHSKQVRRNQIIFGVIAVILILSMALSLVKF
jgi:predicted nucleic acid-binding Zn ribbon protein